MSPSTPPEVILISSGAEKHVTVELARTADDRARGLMYRDALDPDRGMLFIFEEPEVLRFWMKNTYIPLDMIFIDRDRRVVGIVESATPLTLEPRGPDLPASFVLEVAGGYAKKNGIDVGTNVRFSGIGL